MLYSEFISGTGCRAEIKRERENIRNYEASKVSPANWDTVQILTAK